MPPPVHKMIITGTGRAGTTFLVELLTEVGLDTGYRKSKAKGYYEHCSAGLEQELRAEPSPYVVKNPKFCETLPGYLATGMFSVDHVLVPIRELDAATKSRIRIGGEDGEVPGGLIGTSDPSKQRGILAENFYGLMHTLAAYDLPYTLIYFPRVALDADYAWAKLKSLIPNVGRAAFDEAFKKVARDDLIHHFDGESARRNGEAAVRFLASERRRRRRRLTRQWVAVVAALAAFAAACAYLNRSEKEAPEKIAVHTS